MNNAYKSLCHLLRDYSMAIDDDKAAIAEKIVEAAQQLVVDVPNPNQLELPL